MTEFNEWQEQRKTKSQKLLQQLIEKTTNQIESNLQ